MKGYTLEDAENVLKIANIPYEISWSNQKSNASIGYANQAAKIVDQSFIGEQDAGTSVNITAAKGSPISVGGVNGIGLSCSYKFGFYSVKTQLNVHFDNISNETLAKVEFNLSYGNAGYTLSTTNVPAGKKDIEISQDVTAAIFTKSDAVINTTSITVTFADGTSQELFYDLSSTVII